MKNCLHWILYGSLLPIFFYVFFRGRINGRHHVPRKGPFIVAANHASYLDPPILAYAVARPIVFLAKNRLFSFPLLGWLLRLTGSEPVHDNRLQPSLLRRATRKLLQGYVVAVFPTGTRTNYGAMTNPKNGASYLSHITQTPVLPVALIGTANVLPRGRLLPKLSPIEVQIGNLIPPPVRVDRSSLIKHTEIVCKAISDLSTTQTISQLCHSNHQFGQGGEMPHH